MKRKNACFLLVIALVLASCASMETRYKSSMRNPTTKSLEKFISDYPGTQYADEAQVKLKELREADEFRKAEAYNTTAAYESFLQSYPDGELAGIARKRIALPDAGAFMETCALDTAEAFLGYVESRPQSKYAALAASRAEYLNAVAGGTLESHRQFIAKFPDNPFVYEARAAFPILLLEDTKVDVGVVIEVGEFVKWHGIFGGSFTKEEVRQKTFKELKKDLEKIGLRPILMSEPNDPSGKDAKLLFSVAYKEVKEAYIPPPPGSSRPYTPAFSPGRRQKSWLAGYTAHQLNEATVNNLTNLTFGAVEILFPTINRFQYFSIGDPETKEEYYTGIRNLNEKIKSDGMMKAIARYKNQGAPSAMVAFGSVDGTVREEAAKLLSKAGDPLAADLLLCLVNCNERSINIDAGEALKASGEGKEVPDLTGNGAGQGKANPDDARSAKTSEHVTSAPAAEEKTVEKAFASVPLEVSTSTRDQEEIADYLRMGKMLYEEGDYIRAIGVYKRILNVYAGNKEASEELLRAERARDAAELVPGR